MSDSIRFPALSPTYFMDDPVKWYLVSSRYLKEKLEECFNLFAAKELVGREIAVLTKNIEIHPHKSTVGYLGVLNDIDSSQLTSIASDGFKDALFRMIDYPIPFCDIPSITKAFKELYLLLYKPYNLLDGREMIDAAYDLMPLKFKLDFFGRYGFCDNTNAIIKGLDNAMVIAFKEADNDPYFNQRVPDGKYVESTVETDPLDSVSIRTDAQMSVFGSGNTNNAIIGGFQQDKLKSELYFLTSGAIPQYIDKNDDEVEYLIPEQSKSYLVSELGAHLTVVYLARDGGVIPLTLMEYDGEGFLLFMLKGDPSSVRGISLKEDETTNDRKVLHIDGNDDVEYDVMQA